MAKRILVVDDEPDILAVTAFRLKKMGYEVITACEGHEALDKMRNEKPDLVFLDMILPGMSGMEICKIVKSDETLKSIPVIVLSAGGDLKMIQEAISLGAAAYVIKPFDPVDLLKKAEHFTA